MKVGEPRGRKDKKEEASEGNRTRRIREMKEKKKGTKVRGQGGRMRERERKVMGGMMKEKTSEREQRETG